MTENKRYLQIVWQLTHAPPFQQDNLFSAQVNHLRMFRHQIESFLETEVL